MNVARALLKHLSEASLLRGAVTVLTMAVVWELVVRVGGVPSYYLPSLGRRIGCCDYGTQRLRRQCASHHR